MRPRPIQMTRRRSGTTPRSETGSGVSAAPERGFKRGPNDRGAPLRRHFRRARALRRVDRIDHGPSDCLPFGVPPGQAAADIRRMIGSISALGAAAGTGKIVAVWSSSPEAAARSPFAGSGACAPGSWPASRRRSWP